MSDYLRLFTAFFVLLIATTSLYAQYRSLEFEINGAQGLDDYRDQDYDYEHSQYLGIVQWCLGASFGLNEKWVFDSSAGYAYALHKHRNHQTTILGGTQEDRTFLTKDKTFSYLKLGLGASYWPHGAGRGFFFESEFQNLTLISANSDELKIIDNMDPEEYTLDISEDVRSNVPSLRLGVGYNIVLGRLGLFLRLSQEIRTSTYFTATNNNTLINRSLGLGLKYNISGSEREDSKN